MRHIFPRHRSDRRACRRTCIRRMIQSIGLMLRPVGRRDTPRTSVRHGAVVPPSAVTMTKAPPYRAVLPCRRTKVQPKSRPVSEDDDEAVPMSSRLAQDELEDETADNAPDDAFRHQVFRFN